jgi:hypothetical protein
VRQWVEWTLAGGQSVAVEEWMRLGAAVTPALVGLSPADLKASTKSLAASVDTADDLRSAGR